MIKKILLILLAVIIIVSAVILINNSKYSGTIPSKPAMAQIAISDSAIQHMSEAVQIKTISYADSLPVDTAEYMRFRAFIEKAYPLVNQKLPRQIFNQFSYLYKWEGSNKSLAPYVIMAHSDVVPVEEATLNKWTVAPFSGAVKDSMIWGRGVIDDKGCLVPILEAAEQLLRENFQPERTIYLSFGHDEEISGPHGAQAIEKWFKENNIRPQLVIDEGGEITLEQFPQLKRPVAAIGVGEKGYLSFKLTVEKEGGHSSMPQPQTAIDILTSALVKLRSQQMPFRITAPMQELLTRIAPGLPYMEKTALANQWLFGEMLQKEFDKNEVTNSLFHTTIVPTIINGGIKDNVIPAVATAIVNSRSLPGDSQDDVIAFMKKLINDDRVKIEPFKSNTEPSNIADINGIAYKKIESLCYKVMPDVIPVPYLLMGGTDSHYFDDVSDGVIKFAPSVDGKGYHGINERLPFADFKRMIFFYTLLMKESGN